MISCPKCDRSLPNAALNCPCGWQAATPLAAPKGYGGSFLACGSCAAPLTGAWTSSPKGRVCDRCWRAYMQGTWP